MVWRFLVYTAKEVSPFGFDSSAPEGWTKAIYVETSNKDESVVIGYINKNQVAGVGESRMYSVDDTGVVKAYLLCDAQGRINLNGNGFSAIRFQNLKNATDPGRPIDKCRIAKISFAIGLLGGSYTVAPVSTDLTNSESPDVKS